MPRALRRDEIRYLERHQAELTSALRSLALSLGLLALPLGFVASTLTARGGWGVERWGALGAGVILLALIGGVVYFGAREQPLKRFGLAEWKRRRALALDLAGGTAESRRLRVSAKEKQPGSPSRYWLTTDAGRFQVGAEVYLATAVDEELLVDWAPHSGLALAFDELPERLPFTEKQRGARSEAAPAWGTEEN